jgi:transposase
MRAARIVPTAEQRRELDRIEHAASEEQRKVFRVRVIVRAAENFPAEEHSNVVIAKEFGVDPKTVGKWRSRFALNGIKGLDDSPRSGRPSKTDAVQRCQIIRLACVPATDDGPADLDRAHEAMGDVIDRLKVEAAERERMKAALAQLTEAARSCPRTYASPARTDWTVSTLHQAILEAEIARLSRASVWRILDHTDLRPHRRQMWLHSPDPDFKRKVTEVCDLYLHPPKGASVICVDEKTGMQALRRIHAGRPAAPGQFARREFEYERLGTRCLLAGFEVHTGKVFGRITEGRSASQTVSFMDELAKWRPSGEVHVVWDNLNTHLDGPDNRWEEFNRRHRGRFHFHYTPIHASWVNQVECFFSILSRRVLRHGDFSSIEDFEWKLRTFLAEWNLREAHPFRWTFTGYPLQVDMRRSA